MSTMIEMVKESIKAATHDLIGGHEDWMLASCEFGNCAFHFPRFREDEVVISGKSHDDVEEMAFQFWLHGFHAFKPICFTAVCSIYSVKMKFDPESVE